MTNFDYAIINLTRAVRQTELCPHGDPVCVEHHDDDRAHALNLLRVFVESKTADKPYQARKRNET